MSDGFTKMLPSVITVIGYIASAVFLALAMRKLPLGTAYAMWTGFGIMGTTILGMLLFKESMSLAQAGCVLMIAGGIIGLKLLA
jgi:quaternary ammonium compound-resistance protein SugE